MKCLDCIHYFSRVEEIVQNDGAKLVTHRVCTVNDELLHRKVYECSRYQTQAGARVKTDPEVLNTTFRGKPLKDLSREELMLAVKEIRDNYLDALLVLSRLDKTEDEQLLL